MKNLIELMSASELLLIMDRVDIFYHDEEDLWNRYLYIMDFKTADWW